MFATVKRPCRCLNVNKGVLAYAIIQPFSLEFMTFTIQHHNDLFFSKGISSLGTQLLQQAWNPGASLERLEQLHTTQLEGRGFVLFFQAFVYCKLMISGVAPSTKGLDLFSPFKTTGFCIPFAVLVPLHTLSKTDDIYT